MSFSSKRSNHKDIIVIIVFFVIYFAKQPASALRCYTCSYVESENDNTCITDPEATHKIITCPKKYCTIMRQEKLSPSGKVVSFKRDCEDKPLYLNAIKTDSTFKIYFRSCTSDLCNDSDGTHSATNVDPNFGASENVIIKGKNHGELTAKVNVLLVLVPALWYIVFGNLFY